MPTALSCGSAGRRDALRAGLPPKASRLPPLPRKTAALAAASVLALRHRGDMLRREAEELEQLAGRRGFAVAIDADDGAVAAHVFPPRRGRACLDRDLRHVGRQHRRTIRIVLAVERFR